MPNSAVDLTDQILDTVPQKGIGNQALLAAPSEAEPSITGDDYQAMREALIAKGRTRRSETLCCIKY